MMNAALAPITVTRVGFVMTTPSLSTKSDAIMTEQIAVQKGAIYAVITDQSTIRRVGTFLGTTPNIASLGTTMQDMIAQGTICTVS